MAARRESPHKKHLGILGKPWLPGMSLNHKFIIIFHNNLTQTHPDYCLHSPNACNEFLT